MFYNFFRVDINVCGNQPVIRNVVYFPDYVSIVVICT